MIHLHDELDLHAEDVVRVSLDRRANVRLMDEANYARYCRGEKFSFYGGGAKQTPVNIVAPAPGRWHLVVDLGGYPGRVRVTHEIVSRKHVA